MCADLPADQRSTVSVSTDEVRHWRGHDARWPRWCLEPAGIFLP